ncbi:MAG: HlyC/CorC family transporter [Desulfobacterales bacterium]|nr:HlyC/CorC family transporter [Desulfobacterales bacterium]
MTLELVFLLICIVGSAFASGSETALVSASRIRLQHLASEGLRSATRGLGLIERKERILAVIIIVTNVFNIAAGAIATVTLERRIGSLGAIVATVATTCVLLVFTEIVPKVYFRHHADQMLVKTAGLWRGLSWTLAPITYPTNLFTNALFRLFGSPSRSLYTTREEIKLVLEESVEKGGLQHYQQEMLESTLDYATTIVREVMVPMSEVALLPEGARTEELLALVRQQGHTRVPVYRDRVDQIVGLVNIFDVLYNGQKKTFVRPYMRPARLVPDTKQIDELFVEMQRGRESLAVVVNEFGACFGIVTLEDIMEEIFGELADEHEDATPEIQKKGPGHFRVSGRTNLDDLTDETGIAIHKAGFETVGGYILYRLGRIPHKGESFIDGNLTVRVLDADRYSVKALEVIQKDLESAPAEQEDSSEES